MQTLQKILFFYFYLVNSLSKRLTSGYQSERVLDLQVQLFYFQIPVVVYSASVVATVLSLIFYDTAGVDTAIYWVSSVYILMLVRLYSVYRYKNTKSILSNQHWAALGITFSFISGIQWGMAGIVYFNPQSMVDIAMLVLIVLAMAAAAASSLTVIPLAYVAYAMSASILVSLPMLKTGTSDFYMLGSLVIIYLITTLLFARNIYKTTMKAIRLSIENEDLVKSLQIEKDKAESANLSKSRFLAAASHDLRQPMQAITLFTEALKENVKSEKNLGLVGRISKSLDALKGLLNSLLDISKLDAGGVEVHQKIFNVAEVFEEIKADVQPIANNKFQQLAVSNSCFYVKTDPILLKRIIQNLVVNAINHSPEESLIVVDAKIRNDECHVTIKDNGPGIPVSEVENIFNEFHQLNNPERDRNKGLGLGLAIVKRLSNLLDVPLNLESQPGAGCEFTLVLKRGEPEMVVDVPKLSSKFSLGSFNNLGVLVVEDEVDVRESLVMLLEGWGCEVWQSDNIAGAMALISQNDIKLVITDYRLRNNETGLELLKQVVEINGSIPGMLITGDTGADKLKEFMSEDYLVFHKPIKPAELRNAIRQLTAQVA